VGGAHRSGPGGERKGGGGGGGGLDMVTGACVRTLGVHVMYTSLDGSGSSRDII
jgi:hypothetical protein